MIKINQKEGNIKDGEEGTVPVRDWSGNATNSKGAWRKEMKDNIETF